MTMTHFPSSLQYQRRSRHESQRQNHRQLHHALVLLEELVFPTAVRQYSRSLYQNCLSCFGCASCLSLPKLEAPNVKMKPNSTPPPKRTGQHIVGPASSSSVDQATMENDCDCYSSWKLFLLAAAASCPPAAFPLGLPIAPRWASRGMRPWLTVGPEEAMTMPTKSMATMVLIVLLP